MEMIPKKYTSSLTPEFSQDIFRFATTGQYFGKNADCARGTICALTIVSGDGGRQVFF